jgi:hypothetical protein
MYRRSFIENCSQFVFIKDCLPSFVKMVEFWTEINKLPCLHEIDIPKCINVYSIYRTKLDMIGCFVLSFIRPKKINISVYCHMSKKSRVGIFFFFLLSAKPESRSQFLNPIFHFRNFRLAIIFFEAVLWRATQFFYLLQGAHCVFFWTLYPCI